MARRKPHVTLGVSMHSLQVSRLTIVKRHAQTTKLLTTHPTSCALATWPLLQIQSLMEMKSRRVFLLLTSTVLLLSTLLEK